MKKPDIETIVKITSIASTLASIAGALLNSKADALNRTIMKDEIKAEILSEITKSK